MLESGPFRFRKPLLRDVCDVFRQSSGIFLIHCEVVHAEDFELEDRLTESVPHYIVYNAGTRVLFLYPEVIITPAAHGGAPWSGSGHRMKDACINGWYGGSGGGVACGVGMN